MTFRVEATYEDGVLVPSQPLDLPDHERVTLTLETIPREGNRAVEQLIRRRSNRIQLDPELARDIASSHEFDPNEA